MQLFCLAREQLHHLANHVLSLQKAHAESRTRNIRLCNVEVQFQPFQLEADPRQELPLPHYDEALSLDEMVMSDREESSVRRGIDDFLSSVIYVCLEGAMTLSDSGDVRLVEPMTKDEQPAIVFNELPDGSEMFLNAGIVVDELERMMLDGWCDTANHDIVEKTFKSDEERKLCEHLFSCMAESYGLSENEAEEMFYASEDERTLTVSREFIESLREGEEIPEPEYEMSA